MIEKGHHGFVSVEMEQFPQTKQMLVPLFAHDFTVYLNVK